MAHRNRWFTAFTYYKWWFSMANCECHNQMVSCRWMSWTTFWLLTTGLFRQHRRQIQSDPALWRPLVLRTKRMRWGINWISSIHRRFSQWNSEMFFGNGRLDIGGFRRDRGWGTQRQTTSLFSRTLESWLGFGKSSPSGRTIQISEIWSLTQHLYIAVPTYSNFILLWRNTGKANGWFASPWLRRRDVSIKLYINMYFFYDPLWCFCIIHMKQFSLLVVESCNVDLQRWFCIQVCERLSPYLGAWGDISYIFS